VLKNKIFSIFCISLILTIFAGCGGGADFNAATGSVSLTWTVPTTYVDGTPAKSVAGFRVYYGKESRAYTQIIDVRNVTSYTVNSLFPGTYYFAVTAYDSFGMESDYSPELIETI
jgi:hypothetical protein